MLNHANVNVIVNISHCGPFLAAEGVDELVLLLGGRAGEPREAPAALRRPESVARSFARGIFDVVEAPRKASTSPQKGQDDLMQRPSRVDLV